MTKKLGLILGICLLATAAAYAAEPAKPCVVPSVEGLVSLPPEGCGYQSLQPIAIDTPVAAIRIDVVHNWWRPCYPQPCLVEGGEFGGQFGTISSTLKLDFSDESGWSSTIFVPADFEVHTAQTDPNEWEFETRMTQLTGSISLNDLDFQQIDIVAGSNTGFPGDGYTQISDVNGEMAQVDSFFNLGGTIHIVGTPGGRFDGVDEAFEFETTVEAKAKCEGP